MSNIAGGNYHESSGTPPDGTALTPDATANTKGAYAELIASTAQAWSGFNLTVTRSPSATAYEYLVDIAVGTAASEVVIVPDMRFCGAGAANGSPGYSMWCPIPVPAGTRIAARCQANNSSAANIRVSVIGHGVYPDLPTLHSATNYGAATGTSLGVIPAISTGSKGAYTEITASTTDIIRMFYVHVGGGGDTSFGTLFSAFDIAVGAAASEVVVVPNGRLQLNVGETLTHLHGPFFHNIPAGTRLAVRGQHSHASHDLLDYAIMAFC